MVKNPPANAGDVRYAGSIPGSGRSPEDGNGKKEMATHSNILARESPWTEEPGRLHRTWGHKESNATEYTHSCTHMHTLIT